MRRSSEFAAHAQSAGVDAGCRWRCAAPRTPPPHTDCHSTDSPPSNSARFRAGTCSECPALIPDSFHLSAEFDTDIDPQAAGQSSLREVGQFLHRHNVGVAIADHLGNGGKFCWVCGLCPLRVGTVEQAHSPLEPALAARSMEQTRSRSQAPAAPAQKPISTAAAVGLSEEGVKQDKHEDESHPCDSRSPTLEPIELRTGSSRRIRTR